jgi:hypothetical protein
LPCLRASFLIGKDTSQFHRPEQSKRQGHQIALVPRDTTQAHSEDQAFQSEDDLCPWRWHRSDRPICAQKTAVFFIDPPYTAGKNGKRAGTRLYTHFELDHEHLFSRVEKVQGDFLMTYDNADEVKRLAKKHGFEYQTISMTNTHHATMRELIIGSDLSWLENQ